MSLSLNNRLTPNNDTDANKVETMFEELDNKALAAAEKIVAEYKSDNALKLQAGYELPDANMSNCHVRYIHLTSGECLIITEFNTLKDYKDELELLKEIEPLGVYKVNEEKLMVVTTIAECTVNRVLDSIHRGYRNK